MSQHERRFLKGIDRHFIAGSLYAASAFSGIASLWVTHEMNQVRREGEVVTLNSVSQKQSIEPQLLERSLRYYRLFIISSGEIVAAIGIVGLAKKLDRESRY